MVCKYCKERVKDWEGQDPICGFNEIGDFNKDNWNCAMLNKLRDIAEVENFVTYNSANENRTATIPHDNGFLIASWYKDRGKTDLIFNINNANSVEYITLNNLYNIIDDIEEKLKNEL